MDIHIQLDPNPVEIKVPISNWIWIRPNPFTGVAVTCGLCKWMAVVRASYHQLRIMCGGAVKWTREWTASSLHFNCNIKAAKRINYLANIQIKHSKKFKYQRY